MDLLKYIYRSTWLILALLIAGGLACIFVPEYNKYSEYRSDIEELEAQLGDQEQVLRQLKQKQDRFKLERRYVEYVAHEVGMVHPHETIFKIQDEELGSHPSLREP